MEGRSTLAWWEDRRFLIALTLAAAIPLFWPTVPPLTDLPGHMGRFAVQLDGGASPSLREWYSFDWALIGNLGVDLLVGGLAPLIGLEPAVKLIVIAIPVLQVAGTLLVAREVHGRVPPTAFFAIPFAYAYPFQFGFVNYALGVALAFLAFALWLRLARTRPLRTRLILFPFITVLLWVCHMYGWATFCVLVAGEEAVRLWRGRAEGGRAIGRAALSMVVLLPPILIMALAAAGQNGSGVTRDWFNWGFKLTWFLAALRDRWQDFDLLCLSVVIALIGWSLFDRRMRHAPGLAIAALAFAAFYILLPFTVLGSAYADMRLVPVALATAVLSIGIGETASRRYVQGLAILALLFVAVRLGGLTISYQRYGAAFDRELAALDALPRNARLVSFVGRSCALGWSDYRFDHLPGMALARRHAFANDQWQLAGGQLLRVRYAKAGRFRADPSHYVVGGPCTRGDRMRFAEALDTFPRDAFDHVWVINAPADPLARFDGLTPIWNDGNSTLYRVTGPAFTSR